MIQKNIIDIDNDFFYFSQNNEIWSFADLKMSKRVIIAGGSGFLGRNLADNLIKSGYEVVVLSRNPQKAQTKLNKLCRVIQWDNDKINAWSAYFYNAFAVINLAGENIFALRWTAKKKARILDSRIKAGNAIEMAIQSAKKKPALLIQISGIGYYGNRGDELLDEISSKGSGFMSGIAEQWEQSVKNAETLGVRVAYLRTGLVLDDSGGFLKKVILSFRFFVGGHLGNGNQWISWIHLSDLIEVMRFLMEKSSTSGIFNVVSPKSVTARQFFKTVGNVIKRPSWFHVPGFALKFIFGEMADELILSGQRVIPKKLIDFGFKFSYPDLTDALKNILKR